MKCRERPQTVAEFPHIQVHQANIDDAGKAGTFDPPYPAHTLLHANNRFGLASLANLDKLPAKGAILIAAPLKFVNGTGSPIRALALVPKR